MEDYSTMKRNELSSHKGTWRIPKSILISERSQSGKTTYHIIPAPWLSGKGKIMQAIKKSVMPGVWREGKERRRGGMWEF
jgi:hypothetical protein